MVDDEAKKVFWSLQNNKRTEAERNVFQPTGKKPMNKNVVYILSAIGITFLMSFALSLFSKETTQFCFLIERYCFNSTENPMAYTFYIFMNLWILILGIGVAYLIGKKLGDKIKI
ncbi:FUSC family protein [Flavobacterium lacisediminis]|uniref:FUSC family protein n=1 Tax=Flavobacterium lacisediminis TaxID=2989705 RepID=A0ABT3EFX1_9FLAO|nr:FUSC family protein [Flavobacterium lacisediminis]MCW1147473.1 FUSC family protein [Flavobacterium lacisediminis]